MVPQTVHESPPFAVFSPSDHAAWIIISTSIGIPIVLIFGMIRLVVRRTANLKLGLDDALIAASTAVAIIQASLVLGACSYGFGKTVTRIDAGSLDALQQLYYSSNVFFLIALALSKGSVAALLMRLCANRRQGRYFAGSLICLGAWMIASIIAVTVQCDVLHPWIVFGKQCHSASLRWQCIGGFDIAWELFTVEITSLLVWNLQAPISMKTQVIFAFSFRLPIAVFVAFRLATFPRQTFTVDPSLRLAEFVVWSQAELYWSIISATVPSMRPFLRGLSTTETTIFEGSTDPASRAGHASFKTQSSKWTSRPMDRSNTRESSVWRGDTAVEMQPMGVASRRKHATGRPFKVRNTLSPVRDDDRDSVESRSDESQRMIIRKDVAWTVNQ